MLESETDRFATFQKRCGRQFPQDLIRQGQRQARIAACKRMTDLVPLVGIEEQDLVGVGNRLIATDVSQINAAIGEYKVRDRDAFFHAAMTARAVALYIAQRYGVRGVPKIVINETTEFVGALPEDEFLEQVRAAVEANGAGKTQ